MMKKLFWLVLSTVILTGQSIFAQEADSEVQSSQREDSLLQVVNELSDRVQKTEDAALPPAAAATIKALTTAQPRRRPTPQRRKKK